MFYIDLLLKWDFLLLRWREALLRWHEGQPTLQGRLVRSLWLSFRLLVAVSVTSAVAVVTWAYVAGDQALWARLITVGGGVGLAFGFLNAVDAFFSGGTVTSREMAGHMGGLDARLGGIDTRLGGIDTRLGGIEELTRQNTEQLGALLRLAEQDAERSVAMLAALESLPDRVADSLAGRVAVPSAVRAADRRRDASVVGGSRRRRGSRRSARRRDAGA